MDRAADGWVSGTATESDPLAGSTQAKFDGAMLALPIAVSSITRSSTTATVLAINNGYSNGDLVLIVGATGLDGGLYNGIFSIFNVNIGANTFQYTMSGTPGAAATGVISCRLAVAAGAVVPLPVIPPVAVHLGPGTLQTQGFAPGLSQTQWQPGAALKVFGSGMGVTILQLVGASLDYEYVAIGSNYNDYLDSFEASDFTVDCNLAGQVSSTLACAAIQVVGKHTRTRRIRVINFGTQTPGFECFPLTAGGAHPDNPECFDDVIEDCILEQPSINNVRETTCINIGGGERPTDELTAYHRACVIRRCFLNCEYRLNPVPVSSITVGSGGVATVTTRLPRGHVTNDWVRISGAMLNGDTNNSLNGCYQITYVNDYSFTYATNPAQSSGVTPLGDMWVGRFPSQYVQITSASWSSGVATIATDRPHFLAPGSTVSINAVALAGYNGVVQVNAVTAFNQFTFLLSTDPGGSSTDSGFIGVPFQALSADAGTAAIVELNRVLNARFGGPYHDTFNSRDLIVRNNYYRGVVTGPYQNLGGISTTSSMIPLQQLATLSPGSNTAVATTYGNHGLGALDSVHVGGATQSEYNGYWQLTAASGNTFQYTMTGTPSSPATGSPGYATDPPQRHLSSGVSPYPQPLTVATVGGVSVATATIDTTLFTSGHGFSVGDAVYISKASLSAYNGYFTITAIGGGTPATNFSYTLPSNPGAASTSGYYGRIWQLDRLVVEGNIIELVPTPSNYGPPAAVLLGYGRAGWPPPPVLQQAVLRRNLVRHIDGLSDPSAPDPITAKGTAVLIYRCGQILTQENTVDLNAQTPIEVQNCVVTEFFANQTSSAALIQGYDFGTGNNVDELSTTVEDGLVLAF